MTLRDWLRNRYYHERRSLKPDEILVAKMGDGSLKVLAAVNQLGGVCDDCTDPDLDQHVSNVQVQRVSWRQPKAGKGREA